MPELSLFLPLTKVDAANRLVYGLATAETPDRAGEVCDYASTKPFYERWSGGIAKATDGRSLGNLRAMHGKVAAGKVTQIAFNDDARQIEICAKVVDDAEWKKVEEGVYTGFSQGGAYAKRWRGEDGLMRYTADPSEVSLVDLPCLPSATFQVLKADGAAETRAFAESVRIAPPPEPTNAAVFAKAEELAAAAGRTGEVGDFVVSAREALVMVAEAEALAKARPAPEPPSVASPASAEAVPASEGEVEQVWKAKDGSTFAKKADALAHSARLQAEASAKAAAGPVLEALSDLGKRLGAGDSDAEAADSAAGQALAKVGARNSRADQERIQRMHDDACSLGATCGEAEKAAGGDLAKGADAIEAVRSELAKITGQRDALQKTLTDEVLPQIAALARMVGDQPVPRHLVGRAVTKGSEGNSGASETVSAEAIREYLAKMSPEERADLLIKVSHQNPQQLALAR